MPDLALRTPDRDIDASPAADALRVHLREGLAIVNLRGDAGSPRFAAAVQAALGVALPDRPNTTRVVGGIRVVWAGPDDWFVIGTEGMQHALAADLRGGLAGQHAAVTDVSSGYVVLSLAGASVREVLAQGCPLDLHPRVFPPGTSACTHWFKASVALWAGEDGSGFELLVRRSFVPYVRQMLERTTAECGRDFRDRPHDSTATSSAPRSG